MKIFEGVDYKVVSFMALVFISGFARFESEYLVEQVYYAFPIDFLIDHNRDIAGMVMLFLFVRLILSFQLSGVFDVVEIYPLIGFNVFLSLKMLLQQNELWYRNILGVFVLYGLYLVSSEFFKKKNSYSILLRLAPLVSALLIVTVIYMYTIGGEDSIAWGTEYFFFSSHRNHSGAVWALMSLLLVSSFFFGEGKHRFLISIFFVFTFSFLVLTGSRGSLISFLLGVFVVLRFLRINIFGFALVVVPLLAILGVAFYDDLYDFYMSQAERGNTRELVYAVAVEDFLNNLIFGAPITEGRALYVENTVLAFMQLGGLLGLVVVVLFYFNCFKKLSVVFLRGDYSPEIVTMLSLFVCAISASMFEAFPLNFISSGLLMFIIPLSYFRNVK